MMVETSVKLAAEPEPVPEPVSEPVPEPVPEPPKPASSYFDGNSIRFADPPKPPTTLHEDPPLASIPEPKPEPEPEPELDMDDVIKTAIEDERVTKALAENTLEKAECHIWQGTMIKGEPCLKYEGRFLPLYRLIYYKALGTFPFREVTCKMHPRCINPDHLE